MHDSAGVDAGWNPFCWTVLVVNGRKSCATENPTVLELVSGKRALPKNDLGHTQLEDFEHFCATRNKQPLTFTRDLLRYGHWRAAVKLYL